MHLACFIGAFFFDSLEWGNSGNRTTSWMMSVQMQIVAAVLMAVFVAGCGGEEYDLSHKLSDS
jgi:hypothetical protein